MNISKVNSIRSRTIVPYRGSFYDCPMTMCDTETVRGQPYSVQFYWGPGTEPELYYVKAETILDFFVEYLQSHFQPNLIMWVFFAQFDFPILNFANKELFGMYESHDIQIELMSFHYVTGKTWFCDGEYLGKRFFFRDAFQFLYRSLDKSCKDLLLPVGKMKRPEWLGERKPKTQEEKQYFEDYAKQDVITLWHVVEWILEKHRLYDVGLSVSLADLCGKIFRKKFFRNYSEIKLPNSHAMNAALLSYHGGKTECYVNTPLLIRDVYEYDIKSAYPWAMVQMPNFFDYQLKRSKEVRTDGLYCVSGTVQCPYQCLYDHEFKPVASCYKIWITGYELQSMIEYDNFDGVIEDGYVIESNRESYNPLVDYVKHFYQLKYQAEQNENLTERLWNKLALNALYGKFISRIVEDQGLLWNGGVLFHPLMATCVTGCLRGYVHRIEHEIEAIHTSTDSFITKCSDANKRFSGEENSLGNLTLENKGDILILRRKLYVIFGQDGTVSKSALHGFAGDVGLLLRLWRERKTHYVVRRMIRLKEAMKSRDPDLMPFDWQTGQRSLNIDWSQYREM